jgi:PKD repeat protein
METAVLIGCLALSVILMTGMAEAVSLPGQYYGSVTINGAPAPAGTYLTAWIKNQECGAAMLGEEGTYGQYPGTLDPSFTVDCPEAREHDRIHFFINGDMAGESADFSPYDLVHLDLSLEQPASVPPAVNFTANVTTGNAPLAVQFTDLTETSPRSWVWYFGDEPEASFLRDPVHIFTKPGVYTVQHTATDESGIHRIEKTDCITVYPEGDFNHNWYIDNDDVMREENMSEGVLEPEPGADLNHDGVINDSDIALMMYYYNRK